jgi:tetratricopeptide (TPR) repeat protein
VLLRDGRIDEALALLDRAWRQNPGDVRFKLNYCIGLAFSRQLQEAIPRYRDVLRMSPSSPHEVEERLASAYYLSGERDKAFKLYDELAHKQGYRDALLGLAEIYDLKGQNAEALNAYNEFLAEGQNSNLADVFAIRSLTLSRAGKHDEALAELRKALKYAPGDELILTTIGIELVEAGDLDAGIGHLQSVVEQHLDTESIPFALMEIGRLLESKGDWRGAGDQFRRVTELWPTYVEAHLSLARELAHEGLSQEALSEYDKVAKRSPSELQSKRQCKHIIDQYGFCFSTDSERPRRLG